MLHISRLNSVINSSAATRREYRQKDLRWDDQRLRLNSGRVLATVEPDSKWPGMYRVRLPDGHLTDIVNPTRAKDAAVHLALANLNRHAGQAGASPMRRLGCGAPRRQRKCCRVL
jgi:hypothetical protein